MLLRFSFTNFRSVGKEPINLELVSSAKIKAHEGHICSSSKDAKVLRNAVVYGGNAAGKSNLTRAFSFLKAAVIGGSIPQSATKDFCRCEEGLRDEESTFEVQFQTDGTVFDYGFSCILSKLEVTEEWLYELKRDPEPVFLRKSDSIEFGRRTQKEWGESDRLRFGVYEEDFRQRHEGQANPDLFLSNIGKVGQFRKSPAFEKFAKAFLWFRESLEVIEAGRPTSSTEFYENDKSLDAVAEVLSSFDTGISALRKTPVSMDELDKYVPTAILMTIGEILKDEPPTGSSRQLLTIRNDDFFLGIEREGLADPVATILRTRHERSAFDFDFMDESDGTRRLFDFMDLLFTRSKQRVFVVDELSRSFHPMLTQHLVNLFNKVHENDDCQLVFTTHENDIMSYEYFRRDEIWFVDRAENGTSCLYPLDEFAGEGNAVRSDTRLNKRYLEGRYGGVPVISEVRAHAALGIEEG